MGILSAQVMLINPQTNLVFRFSCSQGKIKIRSQRQLVWHIISWDDDLFKIIPFSTSATINEFLAGTAGHVQVIAGWKTSRCCTGPSMQKTYRTKLLSHSRETGPSKKSNSAQQLPNDARIVAVCCDSTFAAKWIQYDMISQKAHLNLLPAAGVAGIRPQCWSFNCSSSKSSQPNNNQKSPSQYRKVQTIFQINSNKTTRTSGGLSTPSGPAPNFAQVSHLCWIHILTLFLKTYHHASLFLQHFCKQVTFDLQKPQYCNTAFKPTPANCMMSWP